MSKTFKSVALPNVSVSIKPSSDGVRICSVHGLDVSNVTVAPSDGPAMMQAIAECLPPLPDIVRDGSYEAYMAVVVEYLDRAVRALEAETFKAKEQAELYAEALELYGEWIILGGGVPHDNWEQISKESQFRWLAVARKSREIGGRAEK